MARAYGRIASTIWTDPDFLDLNSEPQRLYLFLLSQPDLSHAGLLPLRERRWGKKVSGGSSRSIMAALETLADTRFVVVDQDTEEVLIRTMVRNDGVWRQPKVMIRMREDARLIESPHLRAAFAVELDRLPLHELSDNPGGANGDHPSTRQIVAEIVENLRADFAADTLSEGYREGYPIPSTRAHAHSPYPLPPTPKSHKATDNNLAQPAVERKPPPSRFDEFWALYPRKVGKAKAATKYTTATKRASEQTIIDGARDLANDPNLPEPKFVPHPTTWLERDGWDDEPMPVQQSTNVGPSKSQQRFTNKWQGIAARSSEVDNGNPLGIEAS